MTDEKMHAEHLIRQDRDGNIRQASRIVDPKNERTTRGKTQIHWDRMTMETILVARQKLEDLGMRRPSIRAVLYLLLELPGWAKSHYDTLTVKLGQWRDAGLIPWGLFSDDGAGGHYRPLTAREITERMQALQDLIPASLTNGGTMPIVIVEHISLVDTLADFLDYRVPIISSQGQLRREHLYTALAACVRAAKELGGAKFRIIALTDYDQGGLDIFEAHRRWILATFGIGVKHWAVTRTQIEAAHLDMAESHQLDGFIARYGPERFKRELREACGI